MCSKGGGSPPVPSSASTAFQSTVSPSPTVAPLYNDFLNRANALSTTPFNPAMQGSVAPMTPSQTAAGQRIFDVGMSAPPTAAYSGTDRLVPAVDYLTAVGRDMGNFDPAKVTAIMSPFTEQVVGTTQNWFNNQNAIQGNDLLSQAIRSGNAFGGDRAGVAEGILAGQQQLAQAPVIAGLRQAGYTQALDEYNKLKQFGLQGAQAGLGGEQTLFQDQFNVERAQFEADLASRSAALQGAGAAMGWGGLQQAQAQRELDVAQQNAMMSSAYPFQTLNWYGSILGGIGPLTGSFAQGFNTPPSPNGLSTALGIGSAAVGLGSSLAGAFSPSGGSAGAATPAPTPAPVEQPQFARGGIVKHRARGGLVPVFIRHNGGLIPGLAYGGGVTDEANQGYRRDEDDDRDRGYRDEDRSHLEPPDVQGARKIEAPDFGIGQLKLESRALPQPIFPSSGTTQPQQKSTGEQILGFGKSLVDLGVKAAPLFAMMSDPKTKTDIQRVGKNDDGEPLYGFRYKGDPKTYPKVVGPMAVPPRLVKRFQTGGYDEPRWQGEDLDPWLGTRGGREITGPARGSPAGGLPMQAREAPNLALTRERFAPMLTDERGQPTELGRAFDVNTTAEVGTRPEARNFYQALTMDRAAARGLPLGSAIMDPDYYPRRTLTAADRSGIGVSPSLWGGANPANYGTGNASWDPVRGRWVGFAGGPQTATIQTGSGRELGGIEGPDIKSGYAKAIGYSGPQTQRESGLGPGGQQAPGSTETAEQADRTAAGREPGRAGPAGRGAVGAVGAGPPGPVRTIPGLEKPEPTFGQRWAANPFTQLGAGLLAGRSPHFGVNLGTAMLGTIKSQEEQRRHDVLDAKPELITLPNGEQGWRVGGKVFNLGLGVPATETRATEKSTREREKHEREMSEPYVKKGLWGDERFGWNPATKQYDIPLDAPAQTQQQQQPQTPQTPQPATPQIAPPAKPATPPPQVRQTQAPAWQRGTTTDPRITAQSFHTPGDVSSISPELTEQARPAEGTPTQTAQVPQTAQTVQAPQTAQTQQAGQAGPPAAPQTSLGVPDEAKDTAAQVKMSGGFKTPLNPKQFDPRMLEYFHLSPADFDFMAAQMAFGDDSMLKGYGGSKQAGQLRSALKARAAQYWQERGLGPERAMAAVAEFGGLKAGARALGTQEARVAGALSNAMSTASAVLETSNKVDRTRFPDLNKLILMTREKIGDENVVRFRDSTVSFINAYARAIGGGNSVLTDSARQQAQDIFSLYYSKGQMNAAIDQALITMDRELQGLHGAMGGYTGSAPRTRYTPGSVIRETGAQQGPTGQQAPQLPTITSRDQFDKLAPGTRFLGSDGKPYVK
jgi:hypothetical protein